MEFHQMNNSREFEAYVGRILSLSFITQGESVTLKEQNKFDFVLNLPDQKVLIEVKYFRSEFAELDRLQQACRVLRRAALETALPHFKTLLVLIVSTRVSPLFAQEIKSTGICLIDGPALLRLTAGQDLSLAAEFSSIFPYEIEASERSMPLTFKDVFAAMGTSPIIDADSTVLSTGRDLCSELRSLPCGREDSKRYESLVTTILKFLFSTQLDGFRTQSRTSDGMNIMDMVCRVKHTTGFWQFVVVERSSRYVVFECKNYCESIAQDQILSTEKYLLTGANRSVGFVISRLAASKSAQRMCEGALREHGKLLINLCDDDLCKMLHMKDDGDDPSDYLFQIADDFLMKVGR